MSRHVTYRGVTLDMEALSRENGNASAVGNMRVNARGDQVNRGVITKTADQIARENHRVQSVVVSTGLKGKIPASPESPIKPKQKVLATGNVQAPPKPKETELPSGDIIVEEEKGPKNAS